MSPGSDDGNDRAILVRGNEGPAQIVRLGHRATPSIDVSDEIAILAARPIASLRSERGEVGLAGFEGGGGEAPTEVVLAETGEKLGLIRGVAGDPPRRSDICASRPLA